MDLEAIHAVAPGAKKVLVNALPTVEGDWVYPKIAAMMEDAHRRYPRRLEPVHRLGMRQAAHRSRPRADPVGTGGRSPQRNHGARCEW